VAWQLVSWRQVSSAAAISRDPGNFGPYVWSAVFRKVMDRISAAPSPGQPPDCISDGHLNLAPARQTYIPYAARDHDQPLPTLRNTEIRSISNIPIDVIIQPKQHPTELPKPPVALKPWNILQHDGLGQ
jgi:hypothetical protein